MANTRFKTENGLLVTGGNAQFDDVVRMNANLTVAGDLVLVTGDLQVQGAQVFTGGQIYTSDIVADVDGLNLGNTTNQFNAFLETVRVYTGIFPNGNTLPLGNSTNRWVITANTLNLSGNAVITGNLTVSNTMSVTGAVTLGNTLSVVNAVTLSNTLSVAGIITGSSNVNIDSGVLFVDAVNNRVGINNTAPGVELRVTGAADISSTANIQGNANVGGTLGVAGVLTTGGLVTGTSNVSFDSGVLFVDAVNNRVGINNTAPGVALRVTGTADISSTANIQGNANVGGTLGVAGNLMITNTTRTHHISGNSSFSGGTLFINSVESRVGIGTSTPDVTLQVVGSANVTGASRFTNTVNIVGAVSLGNTLSVTNSVTLSNTLSIAGAANALSTFGISGQGNALGAFGVNGLLTAAAGLTVTGITNTSSAFNVGGGVATTNGVSITNTSIAVGNSSAYINIQSKTITTFLLPGSEFANFAYANSTGALWFYEAYSQTGDVWALNRADGTSYLSTLLAAYRGNNSLLFNANAIAMVGNVNIDSGTLYVDALNNRVGINNTAPGVALRVTGAVDISSTANVQGNANVGGTLGVAGNANVGGTLGVAGLVSLGNTLGNALTVGSAPWGSLTSGTNTYVSFYRTIDSTLGSNQLVVQTKSVNATITTGRTHFGIRTATMVEHEHKDSGGVYRGTSYIGISANVFNGNSSIGGDSRVNTLAGVYADVANYANGSSSNTVGFGLGGAFEYEVRGSGVTTNAWGARGYISAGNNSVTGNVTTAYGYDSRITSNTAMTIATGYLYYGEHIGSTTTNKYGLYLTNESNNYISGNVHIAGTLTLTSTGAAKLPVGTTEQRPTSSVGLIRYNTSLGKFEGYSTTWGTIGGGASGNAGDEIFYENGQSVTSSYTIGTNKNAMSAGPININNGVTVTIPTGSRWVIV